MKRYIKGGIIKTRNQIVIKGHRTIKDKDGNEKVVATNTYNPTEEMILSDGWTEYVEPQLTEKELVEKSKTDVLRELKLFDESSEVNDCIIVYQGNELHYWADKHERGSLGSAVRDCMALGRTEYRLDLRELGVSLIIPCEKLLQMLAVLEVYAIDCYNKTTDHEFAIKALAIREEIESYDFKVGYPSIPRFEL